MTRGSLGLFAVLSLVMLISACGTVAPTETPTDAASSRTAALTETPSPTGTEGADALIVGRTPEPTATPDRLAREVEEFVASTGLGPTTFLGLPTADWANLFVSLLIVLFGYLLGTLLIRRLLPPVVRRTVAAYDDRLLAQIGPDLRWLVVIFLSQYATVRLDFLSVGLKTLLMDAYFVMVLALSFRITWRAINMANQWYTERFTESGRLGELEPALVLLTRLARLVALILGLIIGLSHFGINVTGFAAALGIGGLALSLAAQDTLSDAISGFIILIDRPFRVGDRIEIQEIGTWGDVLEIGIRTTRIRTRDNRMVIVPNGIIGKNQVINYSYPDPRYRIETHVGIAYGTDIEEARRTIIDTVRQVEGVLLDRPVDALYIEMGPSAMIFRVRWWIESYIDTRRMFDRVHTALQRELDAAGVETPYPIYDVNVNLNTDEPVLRPKAS
jgi:MscS family membrane protein